MSTPASPPPSMSSDGSSDGSANGGNADNEIVVRFPNSCDLLSFGEENPLLDVRLRSSDGHVVPANSTLLALKSKFFLNLLHGSFRESTTRVADFPFPRHILVDLIQFIYKERSEVVDRCKRMIRTESDNCVAAAAAAGAAAAAAAVDDDEEEDDDDDDDEEGESSADEHDDNHQNGTDAEMRDRRQARPRGGAAGSAQRGALSAATYDEAQVHELLVDLLDLAQSSDYVEFKALLKLVSAMLPHVSATFPYLRCRLFNSAVRYGDTSLRHVNREQLAAQILRDPYRAFGVTCVGRRPQCECEGESECDCDNGLASDTEQRNVDGGSGGGVGGGGGGGGGGSDAGRAAVVAKPFADAPIMTLDRNALHALVFEATSVYELESSQQALFTAIYSWATGGEALPHQWKTGRFRPRKRFRAGSPGAGSGAASGDTTARWGAAIELCEELELETFDAWFIVQYVENSGLVREGRLVEAYREKLCTLDDKYDAEMVKSRGLAAKCERRDRRIAALTAEIETLRAETRGRSARVEVRTRGMRRSTGRLFDRD